MNHAVEVQALTRHFRDFWNRLQVTAVQEVSFRVPTGSIVGLLGPNGSGKSTTLKLLLGLLHPSKGSVRLLGARPGCRRVRQHLGYLPEIATMYRYLHAAENLRFYASLFGLSAATARHRSEALLEMVGLAQAADRPIGTFSKGMHRRLGLAQALVNDPDLIVLDEPTAGLDPMGCRQIKELLLALAARGKTVLVASHLLADIEDICDEIVILHHGRKIAGGALKALLTEPHRLRFTLETLTPGQLDALQQAFREITGAEAAVDHPAQDLESFFIQQVKSAESARPRPASGVGQGGPLPDFLRSP